MSIGHNVIGSNDYVLLGEVNSGRFKSASNAISDRLYKTISHIGDAYLSKQSYLDRSYIKLRARIDF